MWNSDILKSLFNEIAVCSSFTAVIVLCLSGAINIVMRSDFVSVIKAQIFTITKPKKNLFPLPYNLNRDCRLLRSGVPENTFDLMPSISAQITIAPAVAWDASMPDTDRASEGVVREIAANTNLESGHLVSIPAIVRDFCRTGRTEHGTVCQIHFDYARTLEHLLRMPLSPASWLLLLAVLGITLLTVRVKGKLSRLRERDRQATYLESEMVSAREVQRNLYSNADPLPFGIDIWGTNIPARTVSGDLYEFFRLSGCEVGLLCADVSGKGASAALMVAYLQALMHGRLEPNGASNARPSPVALMEELNRRLQDRLADSRYATIFYGEFDSSSNILRYVNAGHCPAIVIGPSGEMTRLPDGGLPVGLFPDTGYEEHQVTLAKGSVIVIYTDGVTDALNADGKAFGEARLLHCCRLVPDKSNAEAIGRFLTRMVMDWTGAADQADDATLLVVSVT